MAGAFADGRSAMTHFQVGDPRTSRTGRSSRVRPATCPRRPARCSTTCGARPPIVPRSASRSSPIHVRTGFRSPARGRASRARAGHHRHHLRVGQRRRDLRDVERRRADGERDRRRRLEHEADDGRFPAVIGLPHGSRSTTSSARRCAWRSVAPGRRGRRRSTPRRVYNHAVSSRPTTFFYSPSCVANAIVSNTSQSSLILPPSIFVISRKRTLTALPVAFLMPIIGAAPLFVPLNVPSVTT